MNPGRHVFQPYRPVSGIDFYGRKSETSEVQRALATGRSVLITGERKIGKSSLLKHISQQGNITGRPPNTTACFSGGSFTRPEEFVRRLSDQLLPNSLRGKDDLSTAVRILQNLPEPALLFFDDLDDYFYHGDDPAKLATFFRSIVDQGHAVACATSWRNYLRLDPGQELHRHFNVFSFCPLGPFTKAEAIEFLSDASRRSGDEFTANEVEFLISLFGLIPTWLQALGAAIFRQPMFVGSIGGARLEMISAALDPAIAGKGGYLPSLETLTPSQLALLVNVAHGGAFSKDTADGAYLVERGFLSLGTEPLETLGSLFLKFLQRIPRPGDQLSLDTLRSLGTTAATAVVQEGIKAYFK